MQISTRRECFIFRFLIFNNFISTATIPLSQQRLGISEPCEKNNSFIFYSYNPVVSTTLRNLGTMREKHGRRDFNIHDNDDVEVDAYASGLYLFGNMQEEKIEETQS
jgi:hypothetical protein